MQRVLAALLLIPQRGPGGDFATGARRGRQRNQGADAVRRAGHGRVAGQAGQQLVECAGARAGQHGLGAVDDAAAAQGDDAFHVRVFAPQAFIHRRQPGYVRIGLHIGFDRHQLFTQHRLDSVAQAELARFRKGDQDCAPLAQPLRQALKRTLASVYADGIMKMPHVSL
ncbi:hypothetical protein D3C87_1358460 [compost metagenome]